MNKQPVIGVLIIRICHLLFLFQVFLDLAHVLFEVFPLLLLALEERPILLDPLAYEHITRSLINKSECPQYDILL